MGGVINPPLTLHGAVAIIIVVVAAAGALSTFVNTCRHCKYLDPLSIPLEYRDPSNDKGIEGR